MKKSNQIQSIDASARASGAARSATLAVGESAESDVRAEIADVAGTPGGLATLPVGATTAAGSTSITLSDNTKITFTGVTNSGALTNHIFSS